jgi:hypothetical protein
MPKPAHLEACQDALDRRADPGAAGDGFAVHPYCVDEVGRLSRLVIAGETKPAGLQKIRRVGASLAMGPIKGGSIGRIGTDSGSARLQPQQHIAHCTRRPATTRRLNALRRSARLARPSSAIAPRRLRNGVRRTAWSICVSAI